MYLVHQYTLYTNRVPGHALSSCRPTHKAGTSWWCSDRPPFFHTVHWECECIQTIIHTIPSECQGLSVPPGYTDTRVNINKGHGVTSSPGGRADFPQSSRVAMSSSLISSLGTLSIYVNLIRNVVHTYGTWLLSCSSPHEWNTQSPLGCVKATSWLAAFT